MFIDPKQSYTYFSSQFTLRKTTNGWWSFKCPFCNELVHREKMAVQFNHGWVKCWVCGYGENVVDFIMDYEGVSYGTAKNKLRECKPSRVHLEEVDRGLVREFSAVKLPFGYQGILEGGGSLGDRARTYLAGRGFDLQELDRIGFGYCNESDPDLPEDEDYFGYIIIPFKSRGKLVYFIGRDYIDNYLRYKNPPKEVFNVGKGDLLFNEDALQIYRDIYLTEGWACASTIGRKGVSTQGWSLSKAQRNKILTSPAEELIFIPDAGEERGQSFYHKAVEVAMDFIDHKKVKVVDLNRDDVEGKDVNEIGKDIVMEIAGNTKHLDIETATKILLEA